MKPLLLPSSAASVRLEPSGLMISWLLFWRFLTGELSLFSCPVEKRGWALKHVRGGWLLVSIFLQHWNLSFDIQWLEVCADTGIMQRNNPTDIAYIFILHLSYHLLYPVLLLVTQDIIAIIWADVWHLKGNWPHLISAKRSDVLYWCVRLLLLVLLCTFCSGHMTVEKYRNC